MVPHMLGYVAGFMHFLPLLKAHLKSVLGRKELNHHHKHHKTEGQCVTVRKVYVEGAGEEGNSKDCREYDLVPVILKKVGN